jgi:squalene synthase HpnC
MTDWLVIYLRPPVASSDNRRVRPHPRARRVDHYENFPVASWLCPPRLRPPIAAIYWFARTADDIADEGDAAPAERLADLEVYRHCLLLCKSGARHTPRWPEVFKPLAQAVAAHDLPVQPLADLLHAFEQDVAKTRDQAGYADRAELLDYCRRSANPVGRLLLHLYGVRDPESLLRSDQVCTALQLINFWQDLGRDVARGRRYLPDADCLAHGVDPRDPGAAPAHARSVLLRAECDWARGLMLAGSPLVHRVPGRAGWELRAVVQGGLRVLDKIAALGHDTLRARPILGPVDAVPILWRAARM